MQEVLTEPTAFPVVGIGASAGGLESLEQLFSSLPPSPGMAFCVIQHLSPDFRSVMDELLARHSDMPVLIAEHGVTVEPNRIYLMPPRKEMVIRGRRLLLSDRDPASGLSLPIDQFFRSLAQDVGPLAIAVVLSGSGSDGSRGIIDVKRAGGQVLVESAVTAKFDGMPLSALATGIADHAAAPRDLGRILCGLPPLEPIEDEPITEDGPLDAALRLLRDQFGIDFTLYKTTTVSRRVQRRVDLLRFDSIPSYVEHLRADPAELSALYQDLLIGVTQFFRDPEAYERLEKEVLPEMIDRIPPEQEIRVWTAGCATGEETYSLAMILHELLVSRRRPVNLKILATDVHHASLETASAGIYGADQLANVSEERLERFFTKRSSGYQVSQDLRQLVVFARHNVIKDAPFTKMNFISCRNMLIYLQPHAQRTVLSLLHFGLASGGILFLGSSETPGALSDEFSAIDDRWRIYRKRRDVQLLRQLDLNVTRGGPRRAAAIELPRAQGADPMILATYDQLLDRFMPPSFLVDESRCLIDSFGGAEKLLKVRRRRPSMGLLEMLDGELRTVVAGALQRAVKDQATVRYENVKIASDDPNRRVVVSAMPLVHPRTGARHALVTVEEVKVEAAPAAPAPVAAAPTAAEQASGERMETLETELAYTRETLQATIEELETSNEEMQATNEELVASNEELQSTNEELHSVNEELYTVNAEAQQRIQELKELNADIQHLLEGTDVGTIFLDQELRIRRFTRRIGSMFRILETDVGRRISDFSHNIERPCLMEDIERALADGAVIEDEVRDRAGTPYFLRILPYRMATGREDLPGAPPPEIAGVVMTLTDISTLDRARAGLARLSAIVESSEDAIIGKALDGTITTWNRGAEQLYGYTAEEAIGRNARMLMHTSDPEHGVLDTYLAAIRRGEKVEHVQSTRRRKDGSTVEVSTTYSPIVDRQGALVGVSAISRDITALIHAQRELVEGQERIRLLLDSTAEAIFGIDRDGTCTFVNPACVRMLGYASADDLIGKPIHRLIHRGPGHDEESCALHAAFRDGPGTRADDQELCRADGTTFPVELWSYPMRHGGHVVGRVVTFLDITDRKRAAEEARAASQRREQFLAMLSHELRNPLAAVLNAIKLMRMDRDGETLRKCEEVVERQARHMARLLDDLLDVSRITRGKFELRKGDVDLQEAITAAVEGTAPRLAERRINLIVSGTREPLPVRGDLARLQQVIANLLVNAAIYSPAGSDVRLETAIDDDVAVVRVIDHGMGIEPDMLERIFELFVQAEQPLDRSLGGLGVGLSLARSIVELHGGTITAHSEGHDRGAELVVSLPLQRRPVQRWRPQTPPPPRTCRIVLVEDQADERDMLRMLLERRDHVVLDAADGATAVEMIAHEHPDFALIDIGLPQMNGYEVAQQIRSREELDDVVLVALTGYGAPGDIAAARDAGFDDHLIKPADLSRIEELLARYKPITDSGS